MIAKSINMIYIYNAQSWVAWCPGLSEWFCSFDLKVDYEAKDHLRQQEDKWRHSIPSGWFQEPNLLFHPV